MLKKKIYLSSPHMSDQNYEIEYVKDAFKKNWIAPTGENVDGFEKEFAEKIGVGSAVALSSGTAAIHMALKA
jgi:dTDP-4-amino-4,6-dideoxygalactose transaminase